MRQTRKYWFEFSGAEPKNSLGTFSKMRWHFRCYMADTSVDGRQYVNALGLIDIRRLSGSHRWNNNNATKRY
jgi:hypothetical protein